MNLMDKLEQVYFEGTGNGEDLRADIVSDQIRLRRKRCHLG